MKPPTVVKKQVIYMRKEYTLKEGALMLTRSSVFIEKLLHTGYHKIMTEMFVRNVSRSLYKHNVFMM